ncbi:hypothetical protein IW261DRAFT_1574099 [Armillaria novae-zelandiae]|uniref:Uncharacterized protein n=1 Tax=Armillaria novae-zelandiae TaxID=153914 RepID=A0AA39NKT4_9AGAR|nr:hypothetical protein IW261DRAFT_1574099 [Armillaria novae-zelandiae]
MDHWEQPVSEIRSWTYTLIGHYGLDGVHGLINRVLEGPSDEGVVQLLACQRQVLEDYAAVSDRVRAWRNNIVVPSHSPLIHPFDAHRRVFSFFNDEPYTPGKAPEDAPSLKALTCGYDRRAEHTLRLVPHDPYTEPNDCEDFMHAKRDHETRNHRASRDEPTNSIYNNIPLAGPSGLTTTTPSQPYSQPQSHRQLQAYPPASPMSQSVTLGLPAGYPRSFDGLALIAFYDQERRTRVSDIKE